VRAVAEVIPNQDHPVLWTVSEISAVPLLNTLIRAGFDSTAKFLAALSWNARRDRMAITEREKQSSTKFLRPEIAEIPVAKRRARK
jgi:hypothetical protein